MDTIQTILSIAGGIGFLISVPLAWFELHSYFRPLQMFVTYVDCEPTDNDCALILFRLAFVNPSSQTRTVCSLEPTEEENMAKVKLLVEVKVETEPNLQSVTYSLSNVSRQLPFAETLQLPLDILPHQSLSKWMAIGMSHASTPGGVPVHFEASNPIGKHQWKKVGRWAYEQIPLRRTVLARHEYIVFSSRRLSRPVDIFHEGK